MSAYARSPWGGVEVGGILFGKREPGGFRIEKYRPFESEHFYGPSFDLSERDLERLARLLASVETDPEWKDLVPVGWYYSVSQRDLSLTEASVAVIDRFFHESWQLTLVLKRSKREPMALGFFFREINGSIPTRSPYRFSLDELRSLRPRAGDSAVQAGEPAQPLPRADRAVLAISKILDPLPGPKQEVTPNTPPPETAILKLPEALPPPIPAEPRVAQTSASRVFEVSIPQPGFPDVVPAQDVVPARDIVPARDVVLARDVVPTQDVAPTHDVVPMQESAISQVAEPPGAQGAEASAVTQTSESQVFEATEPLPITAPDLASAAPDLKVDEVEAAEQPPVPASEPPSLDAVQQESPTSFFKLDQDPFLLTPDTSIFYPSPEHSEAIANLSHGIQAGRGFIALTGEAGTGKTMVLECVMLQLNRAFVEFAYLFHSNITTGEFFEFLNYDLDLKCSPPSKTSVLMALNERLIDNFEKGRTTVLFVDNAHKLPVEVIEEIELIGNLQTRRSKLLQVVFSGLPEFEDVLNHARLRGVRQRILAWATLEPLSCQHTADYIDARLARAGVGGQGIFSADVLTAIHQRTHGIPRLINAVCSALLEACMERRTRTVDLGMLDDVSSELDHLLNR